MGTFHEIHNVVDAFKDKPTMYVPNHIHMSKGQYNEDVVKNMVGRGTTAKESYDNGVMIKEPNVNSAKQEFNELYDKAKAEHLNLTKLPTITLDINNIINDFKDVLNHQVSFGEYYSQHFNKSKQDIDKINKAKELLNKFPTKDTYEYFPDKDTFK